MDINSGINDVRPIPRILVFYHWTPAIARPGPSMRVVAKSRRAAERGPSVPPQPPLRFGNSRTGKRLFRRRRWYQLNRAMTAPGILPTQRCHRLQCSRRRGQVAGEVFRDFRIIQRHCRSRGRLRLQPLDAINASVLVRQRSINHLTLVPPRRMPVNWTEPTHHRTPRYGRLIANRAAQPNATAG